MVAAEVGGGPGAGWQRAVRQHGVWRPRTTDPRVADDKHGASRAEGRITHGDGGRGAGPAGDDELVRRSGESLGHRMVEARPQGYSHGSSPADATVERVLARRASS